MKKKVIIFDLDNTIYPVSSIAEELFAPLFHLIKENGEHQSNWEAIEYDIMRKPFQVVAVAHKFSESLTGQGFDLLKTTTYNGKIAPFEDYLLTKNLQVVKYLVTTGFPLLQQSKIKGMKIENDFKEIHIVDPSTSSKTKKDVFADIIERNHYLLEEVLVIGDDPESEIKAASDLGIDVVLYDKSNLYPHLTIPRIHHYQQLLTFILY